MVAFGYTLMTEQAGPKDLVDHAVRAEACGFDFQVMSDHYFPWIDEMGHSPYAWSVLGAVAHATERTELMTYVTCPLVRYHPAVVAQKAATVQLLSDGRFLLGLGAGENLNEHVVGRGWPPVNIRHEMFLEALQIINQLFDGGYVNFHGDHYRVDSARLWDLPERRVPIGVAVSGRQSCELFATLGDHMIATQPQPELGQWWDAAREDEGGEPSRRIGQLPISFDRDREAAIARAHEKFRWFSLGWKVMSELPGTAAFSAATQTTRKEDVAQGIPCGPDPQAVIEGVRPFVEAGFTDVALVQVGSADQQPPFFDFAEKELLPALREAFG
ncbi:F420-dependent oxidoreductase, G6PDH family [Streptoalloteichus tenebrarius]|uniref:F420-dependent oxidoreductase, G6PDH family n=1 Tax=Streptoalloteichus tenebrarius (strain ATCC 17920 / DSM 40477 / JCM 4838 / CBS 697.72 / NBRC 16177 / NCIMB 11028 / NRRL B-12390 / A12253. 1 / ISP 5477) TaxID=1933 RepID=A0ABT1HYW7_STRSD|nr:TIGR03557 family F420-dependent LLM class oxidoreductase [Streptoalloteichus tenebrarius]MCP2260719.1 F420-dependent oxidoreductase, G6PDH family [Streptoalloteichus tenebrarius]BFF03747.1 TIGR03557 family F420-dependent LLM class oxidoreductase [Streptoalloteichus tenebrarius]